MKSFSVLNGILFVQKCKSLNFQFRTLLYRSKLKSFHFHYNLINFITNIGQNNFFNLFPIFEKVVRKCWTKVVQTRRRELLRKIREGQTDRRTCEATVSLSLELEGIWKKSNKLDRFLFEYIFDLRIDMLKIIQSEKRRLFAELKVGAYIYCLFWLT